MNYLDKELHEYQDSLTYPDKLWLVVYPDLEYWSEPTTDRHEAEMTYWQAKDEGENVEFGWIWDGNLTSRWIDNIRQFRPVNL